MSLITRLSIAQINAAIVAISILAGIILALGGIIPPTSALNCLELVLASAGMGVSCVGAANIVGIVYDVVMDPASF